MKLKKFLSLAMAAVMLFGSCATANAANSTASYSEFSDHEHMSISKVKEVSPGEKLYSDSDTIYLKITPQYGINENDSIALTLDNGTFDKDKTESSGYLSPCNKKTYDTMMQEYHAGLPLTTVLNSELGNVGCELPYKVEYINENRLRVYLFPIDKEDCDKSTNRVAYEKPYYLIPIYAIAGNDNVKLSVDNQGTNLPYNFSSYIAKVKGGSEFVQKFGDYTHISTNKVIGVDPGEKLYSDSDTIYLKITPQYGINENDSIVLTLDNGTFDKDKTESIGYSSPANAKSYDDMMQDYHSGLPLATVLNSQLGNSGCELPYKTEYLSASQIKVYLFPINEQDCDKVTNRIAYDKPYYYIPIFATAGNQDVYLSIDTLNVALPYGVKKCIATVKGGTSTETTNKTGVLNENISYIFGSGNLNVTGSGEMPDMSKSDVWDDIKAGVRSAGTGEGITKIGESAFEGFTSLEDMIMSHDIAEIGDRAFSGCSSLKELYIPDTVTTIGALAFEGMDGAVIYNYSGVEIDQTHYGTSNVTVINASIKKGDANCDNTLTADDAEDILSKTLNIIYEPKIEHITKDIYPYVDINSDGVLTAYDAVLVLTKVLDNTFEF